LNRKQIVGWALYDFANSVYPAVISVTVFAIYFTDAVVGNAEGLGDLWWGRVISISMLFVALSSPIMGSIADRAGVRKRMLAIYTAVCILCVLLFVTIEPGMILWAVILAVLANIAFEGAMVFYNAYLPDLVPAGKQGRVSGFGFALGYLGSAVGLAVAYPLVARGSLDLTWLLVAVFFGVFSIPSFLWLPADAPGSMTVAGATRAGIVGFRKLVADVWQLPDLRRFLIAYFVFIDGVNTTVRFSAVFAATTLGFSTTESIILFMVVQMSALVGALALAKPTDTWGAKRVITLTLVLWTAIVCVAYFVDSKPVFFAVAVVAGTGLGAVQSASRALMASLIPDGKEGEMFGFYAFCGKSSSVLGALIFGMISAGTGGNQRLAILSIAAFFILGLFLLQRVRDPRRAGGV
jgi:UMF1 family MFS transporter